MNSSALARFSAPRARRVSPVNRVLLATGAGENSGTGAVIVIGSNSKGSADTGTGQSIAQNSHPNPNAAARNVFGSAECDNEFLLVGKEGEVAGKDFGEILWYGPLNWENAEPDYPARFSESSTTEALLFLNPRSFSRT